MQSGVSKQGNEWQKVDFIVEEADKPYPDIVCISAMNDHVQELLGFSSGDLVEVDFRCRCNDFNGRVYNSLTLFKVTKAGAPQQAPQPIPQPQEQASTPLPIPGDDLPF